MTVFRSKEPGPVTIVVPGRGTFPLGPGGEFETDDPDEIAALRQNASLEEGGKSKAKAPSKSKKK